MRRLDLSVPADNGLRRGFTTGSAAAAALRAALLRFLKGETVTGVDLPLPGGEWVLGVAVARVQLSGAGARAEVVKDGGDDPDATHGATVWVEVRPLRAGSGMRFLAGEGVGTITGPGLSLPPGEAAINPVPRAMLRQAALELSGHDDWAVTVGCVDGEAIAKRTFNPRLGILGGVSILGTTGVVEPMSLEAYRASVEVYARVAAAVAVEGAVAVEETVAGEESVAGEGAGQRGGGGVVVFTPGRLGRDHARQRHALQERQIVQMSNFVGAALDALEGALSAENHRLPLLLVAGHPGKLAKVLDGEWDTHSQCSGMAMGALARVAADMGLDAQLVRRMEGAVTVEEIALFLAGGPHADSFWAEVARQVGAAMHARVPSVRRVAVALFGMSLGQNGGPQASGPLLAEATVGEALA